MRVCSFFLTCCMIILLGGCVGPYPVPIVEDPLERTSQVLVFDWSIRDDIAATGLRKSRLANGLLQVEAQLKNQTDEPLPVQIKVKFKDKDNFFIEETNWMPVVIPAYEIYSLKTNSLSDKADDFVVNVRYCR